MLNFALQDQNEKITRQLKKECNVTKKIMNKENKNFI